MVCGGVMVFSLVACPKFQERALFNRPAGFSCFETLSGNCPGVRDPYQSGFIDFVVSDTSRLNRHSINVPRLLRIEAHHS